MEVTRRYTLREITGALGNALKDLRRSPEGAGDERQLDRYVNLVVDRLKALPPVGVISSND